MARQVTNGFSKFDINKSKAMQGIEEIYDSEPTTEQSQAAETVTTAEQPTTTEAAPAVEQKPAEEAIPEVEKPMQKSSSKKDEATVGLKPLKAEKGVKILLPMEYYFKLVQIKACTGKSLQDLAAQGVIEFIERFNQDGLK